MADYGEAEIQRLKDTEDKMMQMKNELNYCKSEMERKLRDTKHEHQLKLVALKRQHKEEIDILTKEKEKYKVEYGKIKKEMSKFQLGLENAQKKERIQQGKAPRTTLSQFVRSISSPSKPRQSNGEHSGLGISQLKIQTRVNAEDDDDEEEEDDDEQRDQEEECEDQDTQHDLESVNFEVETDASIENEFAEFILS